MSSKRPVPQLAETATPPPAPLSEGSESDAGGRRHVSSSIPRTVFSTGTEKAAMNKLKQKMTFSDHSAASSSKSTPTKVTRKPLAPHTEPRLPRGSGKSLRTATTDPAKPRHKALRNQGAAFVPVSYLNEEEDDKVSDADVYASEGEMASTLTISALLSKLDSVKNFLKEAEAMRIKFEDKKSEPGMLTQLNKLDKLIDQLQQQESGYLGELIRLTELDESKYVGEDEEYSEEGESEEERSEEFSSDDEDDTLLEASNKRERGSGSGEGSTLSLRAQVELEKQAEQELMALQKQKKMLTELLEKQKQIQELEARQQALLEMKNKAEQQLREAEAKGLEIEKFAEVAAQAKADKSEASERELLSKLNELKARKDKVDRITELFRSMREEEGTEDGPKAVTAPPTKPSDSPAQEFQFAKSAQATGGASELVDENPANSTTPSVDQLQKKLREAAEARKRLHEAQRLLAEQAKELEEGGRSPWERKVPTGEPKGATKEDIAVPTNPAPGPVTLESLMTDLTDEEPSMLERSGLSDYEAKLSIKKDEVAQLVQEREKLIATHKRLLELQKKMQFLEGTMPDQEAVSQTDLTAATWGGSTVQSDPEDTASSVSLTSDVGVVDTTQESNINAGHGEGATIEQMGQGKTPPFSVTRHTPRTRPNVRLRTGSVDSTEASLRSGKKLKMDPDEETVKSKPTLGPMKNPLAASFKASFKSSPFKSPPKKDKTAPGNTTTGAANFTPGVTPGGMQFGPGLPPPLWGGGKLAGASVEHTVTLQNQLSLTSHMCQQLLHGQNSLIRAVCGRQDMSQVQEQLAMLQQYQCDLEAYYHQLCESYAQLQQHAEITGPDSEEPVIPPGLCADINDPSSQPHPSSEPPPPGFYTTPGAAYMPPQQYPPQQGATPGTPANNNMTFLPPPPPVMGNQYVSPGTWYPQGIPPPGAYPHQPVYYSPYYYHPYQTPAMGPSPSKFQQDPDTSFPQPSFGPAPFPQPFQAFPQPFSAPGMGLGTSFDGGRFSGPQFNARGGVGGEKERMRFAGVGGGVSPSGVTGSSLQVHAPSSPPSVSMPPVSTVGDSSKTGLSAPGLVTSSSGTTGGKVTTTASRPDVGGGVGGPKSTSEAAKKRQAGSKVLEDAESMSSLPMSVPEGTNEGVGAAQEPSGYSVFDTLRDTIYSEVATLIASNENRPHFLVELFRELQMLSTDYLRQRALYTLQDLVTRYLTEETVTEVNSAVEKQYEAWLGEASEHSASEGESSVVRSKPVMLNRPSQGFDYVEPVNSASSISTPSNEPFASDDLGDTVIKLDRAVTHTRYGQSGAGTAAKMAAASPYKTDTSEASDLLVNHYTHLLDEQIKGVMMDVIPVLKENIDKECNSEMIILIGDRIVSMVVEQEKEQKQDFLGAFRKQLEVTVMTAMEKYRGKRFRECGEDLLMDVSEVLFNELAFFKMMEDCGGHPQLNGDFRSVTSSQTTTENEDTSFAEGDTEGGGEDQPVQSAGAVGGGGGADPRMLDPAVLQVLSFAANLTLQEEEDTLGKSRDDSLATSWDPKLRRQDQSSPSVDDEQDNPPSVVELSVSESQPIDSAGSEDGDGVRRNGRGEVDTPTHPAHSSLDATGETAAAEGGAASGEDRGETPPTPVAQLVNGHAAPTAMSGAPFPPSEEKEEANVSIGRVSAISTEDGVEGGHPLPALSPPGAVAQVAIVPQITTTLAEDDLEARMKSEQHNIEGVGGILSSLKEQDQPQDLGLVGDEHEMDGPVASNGT